MNSLHSFCFQHSSGIHKSVGISNILGHYFRRN